MSVSRDGPLPLRSSSRSPPRAGQQLQAKPKSGQWSGGRPRPLPRASGHREHPRASVIDTKPAQLSEIVPETKANASYTDLEQPSAKGWILPVIPACGRGG